MRPNCIKIESQGSFWWIDEEAHEYMRLPKNEMPREKPEWGNAQAGALQDAVWHSYESWKLTPWELLIFHHDTRCVTAPLPRTDEQIRQAVLDLLGE